MIDTPHLAWSEGRLGPLPFLCADPGGAAGILVYLHGGAYVSNSARETAPNAALLASATGRRVVSLDYPLAPASTCERTTALVVEAHRALLAEGHAGGIAYYGDSAGGGLAAGSILRMRDQGLALPEALVLLSPWADLTDAGDSRETLAAHDSMRWSELALSARHYVGGADLRHPYASPVYGDFAPGFPRTLIQAGTREILLSDAVRLYQALAGAGGRTVLDLYDGMPHIFALGMPDSAESAVALGRTRDFLAREAA